MASDIQTPSWIKDSWNQSYNEDKLTDWEKLPLVDLRDFLVDCNINFNQINTVLEIGCGRGLRSFVMLLSIPELNRKDVNFLGIDISQNAISQAYNNLQMIQQGKIPSEIGKYLNEDSNSQLLCQINFLETDILSNFSDQVSRPFDLVIDWMCFHELYIEGRNRYKSIINTLCKKFLLIKVFSTEGSSGISLTPAVGSIPKYQFNRSELELFFEQFSIFKEQQQDQERIVPEEQHSDRLIAAKKAYLLIKKPS